MMWLKVVTSFVLIMQGIVKETHSGQQLAVHLENHPRGDEIIAWQKYE